MLSYKYLRSLTYRIFAPNHYCTLLPLCLSKLYPQKHNFKSITNIRMKYTQHNGVKGIKNRKNQFKSIQNLEETEENSLNGVSLEDREYDVIANSAMHISTDKQQGSRVVVIQPYVKWGRNMSDTSPDLKLQEAEALIRSLPSWKVELSIKVPLDSLDKKTVFGSGKLNELKQSLNWLRSQNRVTCVFISKGTLSFSQKRNLEADFGLPILDRYSVVIQILRLHAKSAEAKIQVAMAEIPYIWGQMKDLSISSVSKQGYSLSDTQKDVLKTREKKLKAELENIRSHRKLLRSKRKIKNYPIVAVVGYTNAGKTSLIKTLTGEEKLQPRDQLFATLDVTAHAGLLPCNLEVIYMDTVGFMSDIPTGLIECFVATLEDAMLADIIIHVQDISHKNFIHQREHVNTSLLSLSKSLNTHTTAKNIRLPPIINVGNKVDLDETFLDKKLQDPKDKMQFISTKSLYGIKNLLIEIEEKILQETGRKKLTIRVKSGGQEMAWLYKNTTVTNTKADPNNDESILMNVIITNSVMQQFKYYFCK